MASTMAKVIWLTLAAAAMPKTYDSHGCCMSCGELWCDGACTTDMAACASGASDLARCTFSWANLHWDLSPLRDAKPADQYYAISDNYVHSHQNWSYVIFKGDWGFEECYRLGSPVDRSNYAWGLIDPQSPAFGIYVQYKGGNTCTDSISDKAECEDVIDGRTYCARSLRINVVCNNRISDIPSVEEVVEKRGCEYALTLNSMYGCPTECPVSGGSVCGNRGVCAYDGVESGYTVTGDVGAARCLCKAPYAGAPAGVATAAAADERPPRNALFWAKATPKATAMASDDERDDARDTGASSASSPPVAGLEDERGRRGRDGVAAARAGAGAVVGVVERHAGPRAASGEHEAAVAFGASRRRTPRPRRGGPLDEDVVAGPRARPVAAPPPETSQPASTMGASGEGGLAARGEGGGASRARASANPGAKTAPRSATPPPATARPDASRLTARPGAQRQAPGASGPPRGDGRGVVARERRRGAAREHGAPLEGVDEGAEGDVAAREDGVEARVDDRVAAARRGRPLREAPGPLAAVVDIRRVAGTPGRLGLEGADASSRSPQPR
ncbi:hypothetical protein JL722_8397 [Aureococcus anophagefferens]|nr:hypothetical protein JL722_8397 [Aureococcus anophagefferens]